MKRLVLVLALLYPALAFADFQAGLDAYNRGDYATAHSEWLLLAERGDARSQGLLGLMYAEGLGLPQDYVEAEKWYRLAAAQGSADAEYNLGLMYEKG